MKNFLFFILIIPNLLLAQESTNSTTILEEINNGQIKLSSPLSASINNSYKISFSGGHTFFHEEETLIQKVPTTTNKYEIFGGGGDDVLEVDLNNVENVDIYYDGENNYTGTRGDILVLSPMATTFSSHTFNNKSDGKIEVGSNTIEYVGLEPIFDNLAAADRLFTFMGGSESITLEDDINPNDGVVTIDSDMGEMVTFIYPTNSLTIQAGTGDDVVSIGDLDISMLPLTISLDGGSGTNTLIIDAMGHGAIDNGSSVTLTGLYSINYSNFTTVTINNQAPQVPTLSQWGFIILILILLLIGTIALKSTAPKKIYITRVKL